MFETILVPVDGSADSWIAADQAIEIAKEENAKIAGLFVVDTRVAEVPYAVPTDPDLPGVDYMMIEGFQDIEKDLRERGQQVLEDLKNKCLKAGVPCQSELVEGIVEKEIIEWAKDSDLVVMGKRGLGAKWAGLLLGSTLEAVVRHSPKPVLATHHSPRAMRRILIAFDGSERAWDALRIVAHWGAEQKRDVVLLTVDDGREERTEIHEKAADYLTGLGIGFKDLLLTGHVAEVILRTAEEEKCDLIALGAYGHSKFIEILFGSTVDDVLHGAQTPVLITR